MHGATIKICNFMYPRDMVCSRHIIVNTLHKKQVIIMIMMMMMMMIIIIIIIIIIMTRNNRKQPYWALHTYFGKY